MVKSGGKQKERVERKSDAREKCWAPPEAKQFFTLSEAEQMEKTVVNLEDCAGFISASSLYLYPPGIPFLLPGEEITKEIIEYVREIQETKLKVHGLVNEKQIFILIKAG